MSHSVEVIELIAKPLVGIYRRMLESYYPNFDYELVKKSYYLDGWSSYDSSEMLFIFEGMDGTLQKLTAYHNPFGESDAPEFSEVTVEEAIRCIGEFMERVAAQDVEY